MDRCDVMSEVDAKHHAVEDRAVARRNGTEVANIRVLGIPVSCIDTAGLVTEIDRFLDNREPGDRGRFVCFRDVHGIVLAQNDPAVLKAHHDAFLVVADGAPLALLGRLRGDRVIRQVRGIQSVPVLCAAGLTKARRHFFLGGGPGVADELAAEMTSRFPGLVVAGTESPPFTPPSAAETDALVARINATHPDLVWVGLGTPKQELWMAEIAPRLDGAVCLGVGAAFDIHTGRVAEAPPWVRRVGFEWAFRIAQEPRRLARRYLNAIPRFVALIALEHLIDRRAQ
jgi:N-acetylglucosaminyldiphosphoundecaprenol N-acetyl-beta-D-mannosaminyltransferase